MITRPLEKCRLGPIPILIRLEYRPYFQYTEVNGPGRKMDSNATLPTVFSAESLAESQSSGGRYRFRHNYTVLALAPHAVVGVKCIATPWNITMNYTLEYRKDDGISIGQLPELREMAMEWSEVGSDRRYTWLSPIWLPSPERGSQSSLFIQLYGKGKDGLDLSTINQFMRSHGCSLNWTSKSMRWISRAICTVSAYWNTGEVHLVENEGTSGLIKIRSFSFLERSDPRPITMDFADATSWRSANFANYLFLNPGSDYLTGFTSGLAMALAVTLAKLPSLESIATNIMDGTQPLPTDNASKFTGVPNNQHQLWFRLRTRPTSVYLAMTVILTWCIITVSYITYTIVTGSASTAWTSGIQLVTLALQSRKPDHMGHTSVGIDSIKTYSEGVGVRVNTDNELELIFERDRDFRTMNQRKIEE